MTQNSLGKLCTAVVVSIALGFTSVLSAGSATNSSGAPASDNDIYMSATPGNGSGTKSAVYHESAAPKLTPMSANAAKPGASTATQTASTKKSDKNQQKQIWNLQNADIRAVIHTMSTLTGKNFVIDPRVQGRVTIVSKTPMSTAELYKVFLSMLQVLGYAAVPSGGVMKVVPAMNAKEYAGTAIYNKKVPVGNDEVILKVVPVYNVSAAQMVPILRPLMHEWGSIMAYTPSNTLILAGSADNVNRLSRIVHSMDDHNASEIKEVELKNANAEKLVKVLNKLQQDNRAEGKVTNVSFAADTESNSVLISGSIVNISSAKRLIHRLDVKAEQDGGGIKLIHLRYLRAKNLVPVLVRLIGGKVQGGGAAPSADTSSTGSSSTLGGQALTGSMNLGGSGSSSSGSSTNSTSLSGGGGLVAGGTSKAAIVAEESNNSILISAPAQITRKLTKVVRSLDVRPMQVLVEAIIVRIDEQLMRQLGIQWGTWGASPSVNTGGGSSSSGSSSGGAVADAAANTTIGFNVGTGFLRGEDIRGLLTALDHDSNSQILATPSVVMLNNQKALISQGENIGIQNRNYATSDTGASLGNEGAGGVPFTTTQRTDVTLKLTVTPQISPNNTVMMKVNLSDLELPQGQSSTSSNNQNPQIETSLLQTSVLVNSEDILVLGGLIRNQHSITDVKVPILGDIPYLGRLFTYRTSQNIQRNLMVFLKPKILASRHDNLKSTAKRFNYSRSLQIKAATGQPITVPLGDEVFPAMRNGSHAASLPAPFPLAAHS